jgi:hypothetical protein
VSSEYNDCATGDMGFIPGGGGKDSFFFATASIPTLGPIELHVQWVPGAFPLGKSAGGVKLALHLHLEPRLRIRGALSRGLLGCDSV